MKTSMSTNDVKAGKRWIFIPSQSAATVVSKEDVSQYAFSRGLRPGSKVCSERYLSLGDLEENEFFPKSKS